MNVAMRLARPNVKFGHQHPETTHGVACKCLSCCSSRRDRAAALSLWTSGSRSTRHEATCACARCSSPSPSSTSSSSSSRRSGLSPLRAAAEGQRVGVGTEIAAATATEKVVEEALKYKATLGNGFSMHAPMVALALSRLGATETQILEQFEAAREKQKRYKWLSIEGEEEETTSIGEENWKLHVNDTGENENAFRAFFRSGQQDAVVQEVLKYTASGVHSRLHHGVIRLAYAMEMEMDEEIVAALAAITTNYKSMPRVSREESARDLAEAMDKIQKMHSTLKSKPMGMGKKYTNYLGDSSIVSKIPDVQDLSSNLSQFVAVVVRLYLLTPNIFTLHMITGLHALLVLESHFGDSFDEALKSHYTSVAAMYLAVKCPDIFSKVPDIKWRTWDELRAHVFMTKNDHDIKFVDTCLYLSNRFPELAHEIQLAASTLKKK